MKHPFLVLYDYGQGGVWAVILARSESEIRRRFPMLEVHRGPPDWLTGSDLSQIEHTMTIDIDDETNAFLAALRADAD